MARVLVVDDEKLIVKGIRFSLGQDGYEVDCAYDGDEAIERAKEREYDVVLLDVMLPGHDGFEVCQTIREFSEMPIIMLTAKGDDMDKILGLEYGADDYITKPFNILEVKARIKAIIRRNNKKSGAAKRQESSVVRDHIQSENRLVRAVRPVAGGIFVHLVINRFGICGAAIDEAYDLSVRFRNKKALRKCRDAGLKRFLCCGFRRREADCFHLGNCRKVRRADWANCVCHKIFLL